MSPIQTVIDPQRNLTIHTVNGSILVSEVIASVDTYYKGTTTQMAIWDFSAATFEKIKSQEVALLSHFTNHIPDTHQARKTALIFSSDEGYGLGRMYDSRKEMSCPEHAHMCFRAIEDAFNWLGLIYPTPNQPT